MMIDWTDLTRRSRLRGQIARMTIGVFDGLHLGHRQLIRSVVEGAKETLPVVITFRVSPSQVLATHSFPGLILSHAQKLSRLESLGIRAVVLIDFSSEMSNLSGEAFIALLKENCAIEKLVVGANFRFGRGREAGPDDLKEMLSDTGHGGAGHRTGALGRQGSVQFPHTEDHPGSFVFGGARHAGGRLTASTWGGCMWIESGRMPCGLPGAM